MAFKLHIGKEEQKDVSGIRSISSGSEARKCMLFRELWVFLHTEAWVELAGSWERGDWVQEGPPTLSYLEICTLF